MHSVTVRLRDTEFSAVMTAIGEWLDATQYEPTRYKYDHNEDDVLVTVNFPTEAAAQAFATRFDGVFHRDTTHQTLQENAGERHQPQAAQRAS
jgi:hypothetical protein